MSTGVKMAVHAAWRASCRAEHTRFVRSLRDSRRVQETCLRRTLSRNRHCLYGQQHDFGRLPDVPSYQQRLPLTTYDDYAPYIDQIAAGESAVLTADEVLLFEPTSGSSGGRKLIPYTRSLKTEFQRGIKPWIYALYSQFPSLARGRAYWSISPPVAGEERQRGVIPVGFDNDWSYLGVLGRALYSSVAVAPTRFGDNVDTATFRAKTLAALLAAEDLTLISVWSPSFLRLLLDAYLHDPEPAWSAMVDTPGCSRNRLRRVRSAGVNVDAFRRIWPHLRVVSCWTDAASRREAELLAERLPGVHMQGKGLLSTEAFSSLPLAANRDPVLAVRSHFYEFLDDNGGVLLAHEVERDQVYTVAVTTGGGLYRYRTQDNVLVTGFIGDTPTLRFMGKADLTSDRRGEKLNAGHVSEIVDSLLRGHALNFAMLAPDDRDGELAYSLYVSARGELPQTLACELHERLGENPHYDYCVRMGQLAPARVFVVEGDASEVYVARCMEDGLRSGDVKPVTLSRKDDWSRRFKGRYLPAT